MLKVKKLDERARLPEVAHSGDLGFDVFALNDVLLHPNTPTKIATGISVEFSPVVLDREFYIVDNVNHTPSNLQKYGLLVLDRSSMASKGIFVTGGVVDSGYTGPLMVVLNLMASTTTYQIYAGDKIAQLIPVPVFTGAGVQEVEELDETSRGEDGFGSTDVASSKTGK
jgi:dUTP pyrophosphatase